MDKTAVALLLTTVKFVFNNNNYTDEDEDIVSSVPLKTNLNKQRTSRKPTVRILHFTEKIVPQMNSIEVKSHFRLLPTTFDYVLNQIGESLVRKTLDGNAMVPPAKQLQIALWRLATPDSYRSICLRFNVGQATALRSVRRVVRELIVRQHNFIVWPTDRAAINVAKRFQETSAFPGIVGAIDGTHICIPAPRDFPEAYINRKGYHSIQLQAVCDHKGWFIHCNVGNVGPVHDARVFRRSALTDYINNERYFPEDTHLVGDSAYAICANLLTPYADNGHLTCRQKNYNVCLSSARVAIERAFALLKGRWRCLLDKLAMQRVDLVPDVVLACCVLHNICLMNNYQLASLAVNNTINQPRNNRMIGVDADDGKAKRDMICAQLLMREV